VQLVIRIKALLEDLFWICL